MEENREMTNTNPDAATHPEDKGGAGGKTFTQDEVNRIVSDRLAREREKMEADLKSEREKMVAAYEAEKALVGKQAEAMKLMRKKDIPVEFVDLLPLSSISSEEIAHYVQRFDDAILKGVQKRLSGAGAPKG